MRARWALAVAGLSVELREVVLSSKPAEMLAASSKGTVPVLIDVDSRVIDESLDIMLWALRQHDPALWLPSDPKVFERGMQLLHNCDGEFKQQLDRYKYPQRHGLEDGTAARDEAMFFLANLESLLKQQRYLFNSSIGIFDAAILPFVRQFAHVNIDWFAAQPLPSVQAWLSAFENSTDFKRAMTVYPAWADNSPTTVFP